MNKKLAKKLLFDIDEIFRKYNIVYWLDCGTLLGAIREKDFIEWDKDDIDIGVYNSIFLDYNLWTKILKEFTKKNIKVVTIWGDSVFSCRKYDNTESCILDVHTVQKKGNKYHSEMKDVYFEYPDNMFNQLDTVEFQGKTFKVPHNPEKYLELLYGITWKEPHPEITIWESKIKKPYLHETLISYTRNVPLFKQIDSNIKVSLLLPSYKKSIMLDLTLWSMTQQKINYDLEIIVINDGIKDNTENICNKYKDKLNIKYIFTGQRNKNNIVVRNPCFATNIAVKESKGDIIILSAPDVLHLNNAIDLIVEPLLTNKKLMTIPDFLYMDTTGNTLNYLLENKNLSLPNNLLEEIKKHPESKRAVEMTYFVGMFKEEYIKIGGMDEDFTGFAGQDNDLMNRLQLNNLIYHRTKAEVLHLYHKRISCGSVLHYEIPEWVKNWELYQSRKGIIIRNKDREWGVIK